MIIMITVSFLPVGQLWGNLDQSSLVDTHPYQSSVHPFNQLLLTHIHIVGAAAVIAATHTSYGSCQHLKQKRQKERQETREKCPFVHVFIHSLTSLIHSVIQSCISLSRQ